LFVRQGATALAQMLDKNKNIKASKYPSTSMNLPERKKGADGRKEG
jgi:hypothetical protein